MKDIELRLVSELMKNSRRSDRELAKALGISQPTVSRLIGKLQKEGVIQEYTMIPDFTKLGFSLMAIIMFKLKPLSPAEFEVMREAAHELDDKRRRPFLMVMEGMGMGRELAIISFHRDYGEYDSYIRSAREAASTRLKPYMNTKDIEGFLIDLNYKNHFQPVTLSKMAERLLSTPQSKE